MRIPVAQMFADFELYEAPNRWVGTVPTHDDLTIEVGQPA